MRPSDIVDAGAARPQPVDEFDGEFRLGGAIVALQRQAGVPIHHSDRVVEGLGFRHTEWRRHLEP